ncbi:hypothetical protein [Actinomadura opuntiae]|uniref:hypothetical protein n=1 Tax=Actinomadura sp. OS1-43 TaxID=604315 RepID=UPI00255A77B7|nr:hypothetical protein [Actinomadura sp. OS1-43]MDL4812782.1 hypothetical protein [Actinomadura sp. OS1-43]
MSKQGKGQPGRVSAWAVLVVALANQMLWNLWHAWGTGMPWPLAVALGTVPVLMAMGTSALSARVRAGWLQQTVTYAVMLAAIGISVLAQYDTLMVWTRSPTIAVLFPGVGDLAVLIALHTLIGEAPAPRAAAAPEAVSVRAPVPGPGRVAGMVRRLLLFRSAGRDRAAEPVPVPVAEAPPVPPVPLAPPVPPAAPVPPVPDRQEADRTGGPDRTEEPVPARTGSPDRTDERTGPDRDAPPDRTADRTDEQDQEADRTGRADRTADRRRAKKPAPKAVEARADDEKALRLLDEAFAGQAPADVSIGQVRRVLGNARYERGKRLHGLWVASRTAEPRTGTEEAGTGRTGTAPGAGTGQSGADRTGTERTGSAGTPSPDRTGTPDRPDAGPAELESREPETLRELETVPA